jgi:hypothetical protein
MTPLLAHRVVPFPGNEARKEKKETRNRRLKKETIKVDKWRLMAAMLRLNSIG